MAGITLVKADYLSLAGIGTQKKLVDLGLAIDEMARILAIHVSVQESADQTVGAEGQIAYCWDPEEETIVVDEDKYFTTTAFSSAHVGTAYGGNTMISEWFDFTGLQMVTTRDLSLIGASSTPIVWKAWCHVYYEKLKPTQLELVQLIAARR